MKFDLEFISIFSGCSEATLKLFISGLGSKLLNLVRGDVAFRQNDRNDFLIVVLSGQTEVTKGDTIIRFLSKGDVFGVSTLFSENDRIDSTITSTRTTELLCIPKESVAFALQSDRVFLRNYLYFLSDRVQYLNGIINRYTGSNAAKRLAGFIQAQSRMFGSSFCINMSNAAASINIARATVYRAAGELQQLGLIEKSGKDISIIDADELDKFIEE